MDARDCKLTERGSTAELEPTERRLWRRLNCHCKLANVAIKVREAASPDRPTARLDDAHDARCRTRTDAISPHPALKQYKWNSGRAAVKLIGAIMLKLMLRGLPCLLCRN